MDFAMVITNIYIFFGGVGFLQMCKFDRFQSLLWHLEMERMYIYYPLEHNSVTHRRDEIDDYAYTQTYFLTYLQCSVCESSFGKQRLSLNYFSESVHPLTVRNSINSADEPLRLSGSRLHAKNTLEARRFVISHLHVLH